MSTTHTAIEDYGLIEQAADAHRSVEAEQRLGAVVVSISDLH